MRDKDADLNQRIARHVRELRRAQGLSLEALAEQSGVSRSMISLIERGETSPTAVVLEKLSAGLGTVLAALFEAPSKSSKGSLPSARSGRKRQALSRRSEQQTWQDPASGYVRRVVTPVGCAQPMQIVEVQFPAGARVAFENAARGLSAHQQLWLLAGSMEVTHGSERYRLKEGDCLAMSVDRPTLFHNPGKQPARYAVVFAAESAVRS